jgi:hypothetical protein
MEFEEAEALINGNHSAFGPRPVSNTVPWAVYIEAATGGKRRPHNSDRWRNSGGNIGSVTWPAENARIRRKYGTIMRTHMKEGGGGEKTLNFIKYSRVHTGSDVVGANEVTIFQAVPPARLPKPPTPRAALSFDEAERLLRGGERVSQLSARPYHLATSAASRAIFYERRMSRRPGTADRWNTSGGVKGSTVWPHEGAPRVRRRYGKIMQRGSAKSEGGPPSLRYVVYSQIGIAPSAAGGVRGDADEQGKRPPPVDLQPRLYEIIPGATDGSLTKKRKSRVALARPGGKLPAQSGGKLKVQRLAALGASALAFVIMWLAIPRMMGGDPGGRQAASGPPPGAMGGCAAFRGASEGAVEPCVRCVDQGLQISGVAAEDFCPIASIYDKADPGGLAWCMPSCSRLCTTVFESWVGYNHGCGPRNMQSTKMFQDDHDCTVDASHSTFGNFYRTCRYAPEPVPSNHRIQPVKWTLGQGVGAGSCDSICEAKGDFLLSPGVRWACLQDALTALHDAPAVSVHGAFLSTMDADSQINNDMVLKATSYWENSLANDNKRIERIERGPRQPGWVKSKPGEPAPENFAPMLPGCVRAAAPYVDRALPTHAAPDSPATALHAALCWGCPLEHDACASSKCGDVPSDDSHQRLCPCQQQTAAQR